MQILMASSDELDLSAHALRSKSNDVECPGGTGGTRVASVAVLEENKQGAWQQSQDHIHGMA